MRPAERLRAIFLRWDRIAFALVLAVPLGISSVLGFLWLHERGWLMWFVIGSLVFVALVRLSRSLARWRSGRADDPSRLSPLPELQPAADPDWTPGEHAALERARVALRTRLQKPLAWDVIPSEALRVVEGVAVDLSGGRKGVLDFTAPEALLLMHRLSERYRDLIRSDLPFADRISIKTLWWLWSKQDLATDVARNGWLVWRGVRLLANPASAVLREAERLLAGTLQDRAELAIIRDLQFHLLDEAAQAAVDLYSGRLRFTDEELGRARLPEAAADAEREEILPLRVVVMGQLSAGKSSLVNALSGEDLAETDAAPVTEKSSAHEIEIEGIGFRLIDTPGLDGGEKRRAHLLGEMARADLLLWVLRADRPDRAPDLALREAWEAELAKDPARRRPAVITVASAADRLLPGWPWPEHALPRPSRARIEGAMAAIGEDWGAAPIPISSLPPEWNLDALRGALLASVPEARQVQRQRQRLAAGKLRAGEVLGQAGRGLRSLGRKIASGVRERVGR